MAPAVRRRKLSSVIRLHSSAPSPLRALPPRSFLLFCVNFSGLRCSQTLRSGSPGRARFFPADNSFSCIFPFDGERRHAEYAKQAEGRKGGRGGERAGGSSVPTQKTRTWKHKEREPTRTRRRSRSPRLFQLSAVNLETILPAPPSSPRASRVPLNCRTFTFSTVSGRARASSTTPPQSHIISYSPFLSSYLLPAFHSL